MTANNKFIKSTLDCLMQDTQRQQHNILIYRCHSSFYILKTFKAIFKFSPLLHYIKEITYR